MKIIISSAKTMNFGGNYNKTAGSPLLFAGKVNIIQKLLATKSYTQLEKILSVSEKIAKLNYDRFKNFDEAASLQAILAYNGDVYKALDANNFNNSELNIAQEKLRIISGLYGLLRPLDLIKPYRLEITSKVTFSDCNNLYDFWQDAITDQLNKELADSKSKLLINLASKEYEKAVELTKINGKVINIIFKENNNGKLATIGLLAKKARGLMARFIIKNKIESIEEIKQFNHSGYRFVPILSDDQNLIFVSG